MRSREKTKLKQTCCFTGHRKISAKVLDTVSKRLKETVDLAIQNGYRCFITGGATGFDTLSAQAVLNAKQEHNMHRKTTKKSVILLKNRNKKDREILFFPCPVFLFLDLLVDV